MKRNQSIVALQALVVLTLLFLLTSCVDKEPARTLENFNANWQFSLADSTVTIDNLNDQVDSWRTLNLPHDWSIEGEFSESHPAGVGGGALPGGIGWYKKDFKLETADEVRNHFLQFDGVYQNSTVWVNGHLVGKRPNGYISFEYDITPFVYLGDRTNVLVVKVDNADQPNSRWYSGAGIYRDVRLVTLKAVYVPHWGTHVVVDEITNDQADVFIQTRIYNSKPEKTQVDLITSIVDAGGNQVSAQRLTSQVSSGEEITLDQQLKVSNPDRWTLEYPVLYKAISQVYVDGEVLDEYETSFGVRDFEFDIDKGFFLNGNPMKIKGVCLHHDLGSFGAAFNVRAMERQLEIMKAMGVNAIRTSHNPPAPQVLDLCDQMGLLVMDEMFDMWKAKKSKYDYAQYWEEWHKQDLQDLVKRDRNHPSVIVWSVGNEIIEQYNHEDSTGGVIAKELATIVRELDSTRPVTTANNDPSPENPLIKYGDMEMVGYNYHHEMYEDFPKDHPGKTFIATETNSSLATRGHYDMPSDSVRIWPIAWDKPFLVGNPDNTVSAYDHVRTPWGSLQEETWQIIKKHDYLSGMFIWTGFDYLGEPTPYGWPSRSSYFGLVDLAGFPKDTYYMYQSEWTEDTVLHVFPHWNWEAGQTVDVWAYYNQADEVELFLNGVSLGTKSKNPEAFHVMWQVPFEAGTLRAVSRKDGKDILVKEVHTARQPTKLSLQADRTQIVADGVDLSFITVSIEDKDGSTVPYADSMIEFELSGPGSLVGVDNGDPTSHLSFKGQKMRAFHGKCLVVVQSSGAIGSIELTAKLEGLGASNLTVMAQ